MPHKDGHLQNTLFKLGHEFNKSVGLIRPVYTGKKHRDKTIQHPIWPPNPNDHDKTEAIIDFPLLFLNDSETGLHFGQKVSFLPHLISKQKNKWLVVLKDIWAHETHEKIEKLSLTKNTEVNWDDQQIKSVKRMANQHKDYIESDSFKIIYCGIDPKNKGLLTKQYSEKDIVRKTDAEVIDWLVENAVSFDDMNLATN